MRAVGFLFWKSYGPATRNAGSFLRKELGDRAAVCFSIRLAFPYNHDGTG